MENEYNNNNKILKQSEEYLSQHLSELEKSLSYDFKDKTKLLGALTHSTYAYENKKDAIKDNERLEFLGDCVLDMIIGDLLFKDSSEMKEGVMSKRRALIVCETTLSALARKINIGDYLLLGKGEEQTKGRNKNSNLSNAMESVIAAVYLDSGFDAAYELVKRLFEPYFQKACSGAIVYDYKSEILEYVQGIGQIGSIIFKIVKEEGPDHDRTFFSQVNYYSMIIGCGTGATKKDAEQDAAKKALSHIKTIKNPQQFTPEEYK